MRSLIHQFMFFVTFLTQLRLWHVKKYREIRKALPLLPTTQNSDRRLAKKYQINSETFSPLFPYQCIHMMRDSPESDVSKSISMEIQDQIRKYVSAELPQK